MENGQNLPDIIPPRTITPWTKSPSDRIPLLKDTGRILGDFVQGDYVLDSL